MILFDDYLYRGPKPTIDELQQQGIKAALNLESGSQVIGDSLPLLEAMACEAIGIKVYPHPLGGILLPTLEELKVAVVFLKRQKKNVIPTLIHCEHGHERTGIVVASYRVLEQGWTPEAAAKECFDMGMHRIYFPWTYQLRRLT